MHNAVVHKYLAVHAEREVDLLADFPARQNFDHCLVIPAYNETAEFFTRLQLGPLHRQNALCILVINQPVNDADTRINDLLMQQICLSGEVLWHNQHLQLLRYGDSNGDKNGGSNNAWLVVDRFHPSDESENQETIDRRLPDREAVGLARKIGCDIAVALMARSQIRSTWIHSTDADVFLPRNYFDIAEPDGYSAAIYDFKHQNDGSAVGRATALYEQALHYYVKGLAWAGSPYAYHTIGSTLAINARTYCHVRGFPRRSGGEDFYLLNKLAKLGKIYHVADATLRIKARESSRVPFGTGPAVAEIMGLANPESDYTYYNPQTFVCLREWLRRIPQVWADLVSDSNPLEHLSRPTAEAIEAADWPRMVRHLKKQAKNSADGARALHNWFDAFQTLKFIHYLQKHYYPALPLKDCLAQAEFIDQ